MAYDDDEDNNEEASGSDDELMQDLDSDESERLQRKFGAEGSSEE